MLSLWEMVDDSSEEYEAKWDKTWSKELSLPTTMIDYTTDSTLFATGGEVCINFVYIQKSCIVC